jgi:TRAP-type transport system periplasmic protein
MMRKIILACITAAGALGVATLFSWPSDVRAADPVTWKLDWTLVEARTESKLVKQYVERVNQRTTGKFKIEVAYGGSLGINQADGLRALKSGGVDMSLLYAGYLFRDLPELGFAYATAAAETREQVRKVAPVLAEINAEGYSSWEVTTVANVMIPTFNWHMMCKTPVSDLKTLRTKKLRANEKSFLDAMAILKVQAQIVPQTETYLALQTGVIDCTIYPVAIAKTISLQEVAKNASQVLLHSAMPISIGVSNAKWNALDPAARQVLTEEGQWLWQRSLDDALDAKAMEALDKNTLDTTDIKLLTPFPADERRMFNEAIIKIWAEQAAKIGKRAPQWRERVLKAME